MVIPNFRKRKSSSTQSLAGSKRQRFTTSYASVQRTAAPRRVELKYDSGTITASSINNTGQVTNLLSVPNGTGDDDRIGKLINLHSISGKWHTNVAANHNGAVTTLAIVFDKQPNGATPAYTDIFNNADPSSLINPLTRNRFQVLYTKTFITTANDTLAYVHNPAFQHSFEVSLKGKSSTFVGSGSTIADIESGAIYFTSISNQNGVNQVNLFEQINYFE